MWKVSWTILRINENIYWRAERITEYEINSINIILIQSLCNILCKYTRNVKIELSRTNHMSIGIPKI